MTERQRQEKRRKCEKTKRIRTFYELVETAAKTKSEVEGKDKEQKRRKVMNSLADEMIGWATWLENADEATGNIVMEEEDKERKAVLEETGKQLAKAAKVLREAAEWQKRAEAA